LQDFRDFHRPFFGLAVFHDIGNYTRSGQSGIVKRVGKVKLAVAVTIPNTKPPGLKIVEIRRGVRFPIFF
jgi:hypothetical protein